MEEGVFALGDVQLQGGETLPEAHLAYATHGTLNAAGDNAVVFPTWFAGRHQAAEPYIGPGKALDPQRYFIVVPDMFTNGLSTSPSNAKAPFSGANFPLVTPYDNVLAQHRLLTEGLGISRLQLMLGFSMSGQQAYHWGALFPEMVERICITCGSARTSPHNRVYLETYLRIMESAENWNGGECHTWTAGTLATIGTYAATMALSQDWYREGKYQEMGAGSVDELLAQMPGFFADWQPMDLYAQTRTWIAADVSANQKFNGDLDAALDAITARTLVLPCDTDMYFRVADNEPEVARMPNAEMRVIRSSWGHLAALPGVSAADDAFVDAALKELLASE